MPTFWTIQHVDHWKAFEQTGVLQASDAHVDPDFQFAYGWMRKQMQQYIPCPMPPLYPLWAWYKYDTHRYRPDLRRAAHLPSGTPGVLITFEADFSQVLLTDFVSWHMVLNSQKELKCFSQIIIEPTQKRRLRTAIIQATLWRVTMEQVKQVTYFKAR